MFVPTDMTWLVRVDAFGTGKFESGIATDLPNGATPATIIFSHTGAIEYYNAADVAFPGNPTFGLGTVYRVELQNIDGTGMTYDAHVYNHGTNALVASATGLPLQVAIPNTGVSFYGVHRSNDTGVAMIDEVTAVPEPGTIALLCAGTLGLAVWGRRRSQPA
jgi:hypothetical protein